MNEISKLLYMASMKFGKITIGEKKLLENIEKNKLTNLSSYIEEENDPATAEGWSEERIIRADIIDWICNDKQIANSISSKGLTIKGARIDGKLQFRDSNIEFQLSFFNCRIKEGLTLINARCQSLNLNGSLIIDFKADGLVVKGNLFMRQGFRSLGEARLLHATISGDIDCRSSCFSNPNGIAFHADGLKCTNLVMSDGFKAEGEVRLNNAEISGFLLCDNGEFLHQSRISICAEGLVVNGSVFMRYGFKSFGKIIFARVTIGGDFDCIEGRFSNPSDYSLIADDINIDGNLFMRNFKSEGGIRLPSSKIGNNFECDNSSFDMTHGKAIDADSINVGGSVFLRNRGASINCVG